MFEIKNNEYKGKNQEEVNNELYRLIGRLSVNLDISTLSKIIIPDDFEEELTEFQISKGLKVEFTNNEHAVACAKTISFFADNQLENVIFIHKNIVNSLFNQELSQNSINITHHELCHVHDNKLNYKYFGDRFLGEYYGNIFEISTTHAHALFSEYVANSLSSSTKDFSDSLSNKFILLTNMIQSNKTYIDKYINEYNRNKNAIEYFKRIQLHSFELLRVITDVCSLSIQIDDITNYEILMTEVDKVCDLQEFYNIFIQLSSELNYLYGKYPLKKIDDYNELANIVENCWKLMHLEIIHDMDGVLLKIG